MKKISILFLFTLVFSFNSCQDFDNGFPTVEDPGNGSVVEKGIFKAVVAGEEFTANTTNAVVTDNYVAITGFRSAKGDLIQLILPSNKIGTYTWDNSKANAEKFVLAYAEEIGGFGFVSASNEDAAFLGVENYTDTAIIKITAVDKIKKTISGTFQFTGFREVNDDTTETKVITNGSFTNIPYTVDIPVEESDDQFTAKIEGVDFIEDKIDVTSVNASGSNPYYSIVAKKNAENSDSVGLKINKAYSVGTYQASSVPSSNGVDLVNVIGASCKIGGVLYNSKSGSITITLKTTTQLEGTFNFVIDNFNEDDQKTITGSFNINIEDID